MTLIPAPSKIIKKVRTLAANNGMQSFKFATCLIAGVNSLLQQNQDQEDQDDDKD